MLYVLSPNMNLDGIVWLILGIMLIPAAILALIGLMLKKNHPKAAKVLFILAVVYTIISLGACGAVIAGG